MTTPKKPPPLDEVRRRLRDPKTKVVMASQDAINELSPYVDHVLAAIKDVTGIGGATFVSDESCLSDFFAFGRDRSQDQRLYDQIGEKIGIPLDRANDDDHFIVRVALKLKRSAIAPS
jgi:hypothetical protein